jgi:nucleoside-diphosphate-sugar epimerase
VVLALSEHVLISLLQDTNTVINLDKAPSALHGASTQTSDVREPESFTSQLAGQDAVILLAAEHRDDVSPASLYYDVNVDGMRNVLQAMDTQGSEKYCVHFVGRDLRDESTRATNRKFS